MTDHAVSDDLEAVTSALADGTRRSLLRLVRDREASAGELADAFPAISRPAVSQHLRVLERAGLVAVRPCGSRRLYRARREGLLPVTRFVDEMWGRGLDRLKAVAEAAGAPAERPGAAAGADR